MCAIVFFRFCIFYFYFGCKYISHSRLFFTFCFCRGQTHSTPAYVFVSRTHNDDTSRRRAYFFFFIYKNCVIVFATMYRLRKLSFEKMYNGKLLFFRQYFINNNNETVRIADDCKRMMFELNTKRWTFLLLVVRFMNCRWRMRREFADGIISLYWCHVSMTSKNDFQLRSRNGTVTLKEFDFSTNECCVSYYHPTRKVIKTICQGKKTNCAMSIFGNYVFAEVLIRWCR